MVGQGTALDEALVRAAREQSNLDAIERNALVNRLTTPDLGIPHVDSRNFARLLLSDSRGAMDFPIEDLMDLRDSLDRVNPELWRDVQFHAMRHMMDRLQRSPDSSASLSREPLMDEVSQNKLFSNDEFRERMVQVLGEERVKGVEDMGTILARVSATRQPDSLNNAMSLAINSRMIQVAESPSAIGAAIPRPVATFISTVLIDNPISRRLLSRGVEKDRLKPATIALILGSRRALTLAGETLTENEYEAYVDYAQQNRLLAEGLAEMNGSSEPNPLDEFTPASVAPAGLDFDRLGGQPEAQEGSPGDG